MHWEMRALHHFTVATSRTLPGSHISNVHECWSVQVPQLALDYEPLLNALLAISTLHLIQLEQDRVPGPVDPALLACRTTYLDAALRTHRQKLGHLSPHTADSACFTSILLLIDAFAMLQSRVIDPYEPPANWMRIVQGARTVFESAFPLVNAHATSKVMAIISSSASLFEPSVLFNETNLQQFPHLLEWRDEPLDPETESIYRKTISCMGSISFAIEMGEPEMALCRRFMSFPSLIPPAFLDMVEARAPRALVIMAHFFALTSQARDLWWVGKTPEREVHAIRSYIPSRLQYLPDLPLRALEKLDGPSSLFSF